MSRRADDTLGSPWPDDPERRRPVPKVMGIVNLTPDSFSDGGRLCDSRDSVDSCAATGRRGADLLDLGGESSRPGAEPVALDEELRRVVPVVEALATEVAVPISIDTTKAEVARQALAAGAAIINDITALWRRSGDGRRRRRARGRRRPHAHARQPATMQVDPRYDDVVTEVYDFLAYRVEWAESHGIPRERIAIDPGIGFGKTAEHNLEILRNLERFDNLGCVDPDRHVAQGVSRLDHGPAGGRAGGGIGGLLAGGVPARGAGGAGARRRADGRRDPRLDGRPGLGGLAMSPIVEDR